MDDDFLARLGLLKLGAWLEQDEAEPETSGSSTAPLDNCCCNLVLPTKPRISKHSRSVLRTVRKQNYSHIFITDLII